MFLRLLAFSAGLLALQPSHHVAAAETASVRTYFYVGGGYTEDGNGGHIFKDQMYVEKLEPASSRRSKSKLSPIVLIHGQGQTGTNFLSKPDGGESWTSHFLDAGYTVYIVDQTFRGRSAWAPRAGAQAPSTYSAEIIQQRFTAPEQYNLWPQAKLHKQWPGTGVMGDAIFDAFYSSNVQFISNATYQQETVQSAGAQLLDKIGTPVWLLGHSQGGLMPVLIADARPKLVKGLILLEPTGPPFQEAVFGSGSARRWGLTDVPLAYSPAVSNPLTDLVRQIVPPPVANSDNSTIACVLQATSPAPRTLPNLAPLPILTVTAEASYHAPYDYCTVEFLKQAGCKKASHLELGKEGIRGNGHMMFMERNSEKVWKRVQKWLKSNE
ncbi:Alpha/beta hydrolase family-domain-containing protein [Boeremia exigua]|uniref:Alpha/beta hydrolase family-domain-containing protein n=1 Tax=Boeremia exigua TaxID=749465 RepID=UPI001E8DBECD|nr:Alpha/beta hydrolase family-domain-containing protein [Boeremia exigua]KAH6621825.1 Alpha/beta hydrolase family-domain-containing protein [Boeremia exigua]